MKGWKGCFRTWFSQQDLSPGVTISVELLLAVPLTGVRFTEKLTYFNKLLNERGLQAVFNHELELFRIETRLTRKCVHNGGKQCLFTSDKGCAPQVPAAPADCELSKLKPDPEMYSWPTPVCSDQMRAWLGNRTSRLVSPLYSYEIISKKVCKAVLDEIEEYPLYPLEEEEDEPCITVEKCVHCVYGSRCLYNHKDECDGRDTECEDYEI